MTFICAYSITSNHVFLNLAIFAWEQLVDRKRIDVTVFHATLDSPSIKILLFHESNASDGNLQPAGLTRNFATVRIYDTSRHLAITSARTGVYNVAGLLGRILVRMTSYKRYKRRTSGVLKRAPRRVLAVKRLMHRDFPSRIQRVLTLYSSVFAVSAK